MTTTIPSKYEIKKYQNNNKQINTDWAVFNETIDVK